MKNEIKIVEGLPRADSRWLADRLELNHRVLMRTIHRYSAQTEEAFGLVRFEDAAVKVPGQRGTKRTRYALLTEDQALFIGTMSRNNETVVAFKAHLVKAFSEARKALQRAAKRTPVDAHISVAFQKMNSRRVNGVLAEKYGKDGVREHNRDNCVIHDRYNRTPKELLEVGRKKGLPSKRRNSGKAVMREIDPAGACCMSLADTLVIQTGRSVREVAHVSQAARNVFQGMLALGVTPAELDEGGAA